jgi:hypothetical protein
VHCHKPANIWHSCIGTVHYGVNFLDNRSASAFFKLRTTCLPFSPLATVRLRSTDRFSLHSVKPIAEMPEHNDIDIIERKIGEVLEHIIVMSHGLCRIGTITASLSPDIFPEFPQRGLTELASCFVDVSSALGHVLDLIRLGSRFANKELIGAIYIGLDMTRNRVEMVKGLLGSVSPATTGNYVLSHSDLDVLYSELKTASNLFIIAASILSVTVRSME